MGFSLQDTDMAMRRTQDKCFGTTPPHTIWNHSRITTTVEPLCNSNYGRCPNRKKYNPQKIPSHCLLKKQALSCYSTLFHSPFTINPKLNPLSTNTTNVLNDTLFPIFYPSKTTLLFSTTTQT